MSIEGQSVVIIGGSSGIGLAIAMEAVDAGAEVTIAGRSQAKLDEARKTIAGDARTHIVDVANEDSVVKIFAIIGPLDHLVITASSVFVGPFHEVSLAAARAAVESKFWGQYTATRHAQVRPRGSIIFFSGILSRRPRPGQAALSAINAAVEGLGRALAVELAPIRVNVISPGLTDTPAYAGMAENARRAMFAEAETRLPVRHIGKPEDVASVALGLMCNSFMTGVVVDVDGGGLIAP